MSYFIAWGIGRYQTMRIDVMGNKLWRYLFLCHECVKDYPSARIVAVACDKRCYNCGRGHKELSEGMFPHQKED